MMTFTLSLLVFNIYSQSGAVSFIFVALLIYYSAYGNANKNKFEQCYNRFNKLPERAKDNYYSEVRNGLVPLKAMRLQGYLREKYYGASERLRNYELLKKMVDNHKSLEIDLNKIYMFLVPIYLVFMLSKGRVNSEDVMVVFFINCMNSFSSMIRSVLPLINWWKSCVSCFQISIWYKDVEPEENLKSFEQDYNRSKKPGKKVLKQIEDNLGKVAEEGIVNTGAVEFNKLSAKYSIHDYPVLKNLNFKVNSAEKIGIVGRTGSGKSSLIKLLWRYIKPLEGSIVVDGNNISEVDLKSYRSQISVVTQDTSLIYGTLRENLDPFGRQKDDQKLVEYLKNLGFMNKEFLKNCLEMGIEGSGTNLSMGERQVVALARVLLDPTKLIILDEATSSMDIKTEEFVQKEIEEKFKSSTMLIVAHRLQTVMNCDRILVLEAGKVAVLDSFSNLMNNLEKVENGEEVDGAEGIKFFGKAIRELSN